MNGVQTFYEDFKTGLEATTGSASPSFTEWWDRYTEVNRIAGNLLLTPEFGESIAGADEIELYLARFASVSQVSDGMPLKVPAPAFRAITALGKYLSDTPTTDDVADFFQLAAPLADDLSCYAQKHLGRSSLPVVEWLTVLARQGTLMNHCLFRVVPVLNEREVIA